MSISMIQKKYIPSLATMAVFILLYVIGLISFDNFGSLQVFINLLGDNAFLGIAAVGATFVILSGGIDLSVGSVIAFCSIIIATMIDAGYNPLIAIILVTILGTLLGTGMGCLIHYFEIPPFLVTLGGMFLARGLGFMIHQQSVGIKHSFYLETINDTLSFKIGDAYFPFTAVCFLFVLAIGIVITQYTAFGRNIYAVGGNDQAAKLMGVNMAKTRIGIYAFSGLCSSLAGVVFTFYMQSGNPASCVGLEMDAIAAVVIGGTLLSGGVGYVGGTLIGVLVLGLIQTLISFQGDLNTWWTKIVIGALVLMFIVLQNFISRIAPKKSAT